MNAYGLGSRKLKQVRDAPVLAKCLQGPRKTSSRRTLLTYTAHNATIHTGPSQGHRSKTKK